MMKQLLKQIYNERRSNQGKRTSANCLIINSSLLFSKLI